MRPLLLSLVVACSTAPGAAMDDTDASADTVAADTEPATVEPDAEDFGCITDMSPTGRYYVDNLLGDLEATLAIAADPSSGTFPPGTVLQLVPQEAMVKHEAGWSPASNDWEFFFLGVSDGTTTIQDRGASGVKNAFQGDCFECHQPAAATDYVCGQDGPCGSLPLDAEAIRTIQESDPRCR